MKEEKDKQCTCVEDKHGNIKTCEYCENEEEEERAAAEDVGITICDEDDAEEDRKNERKEKRRDTDGNAYTREE